MMRHDTNLCIVSYDIANDRRRVRVAKLLLGFGVRVQESVFECYLDEKRLRLLHAKLRPLIKEREDSLLIYHICRGCEGRIEGLGLRRPEQPEVYIV